MNTTEKLKNQLTQKQTTQAISPAKRLSNLILSQSFQESLNQSINRFLPPERLTRVALSQIRLNPQILNCNPYSVLNALMQSALIGLEPSNTTGFGYLIPYGDECQFQIGYLGLIELARRSGKLKQIYVYTVYSCDDFQVTLGLNPDIRHIPNFEKRGQSSISHVYAVAKMVDGSVQFEVMSTSEINQIRDRYSKRAKSAWAVSWEGMAKKTVLKRLLKYLPKSQELTLANSLDNSSETGKVVKIVDSDGVVKPDSQIDLEIEQAAMYEDVEPVETETPTQEEQSAEPAEPKKPKNRKKKEEPQATPGDSTQAQNSKPQEEVTTQTAPESSAPVPAGADSESNQATWNWAQTTESEDVPF